MDSILGMEISSSDVGLAVMGTLVLFFVISPALGYMMAREVQRRPLVIFVIGVMLLLSNVTFGALVYVLPRTLPESTSSTLIILISLGAGFLLALAVGAYLSWSFAPPGSAVQDERKNIAKATYTEGQLNSFQEKRLERLKRRDKR